MVARNDPAVIGVVGIGRRRDAAPTRVGIHNLIPDREPRMAIDWIYDSLLDARTPVPVEVATRFRDLELRLGLSGDRPLDVRP